MLLDITPPQSISDLVFPTNRNCENMDCAQKKRKRREFFSNRLNYKIDPHLA